MFRQVYALEEVARIHLSNATAIDPSELLLVQVVTDPQINNITIDQKMTNSFEVHGNRLGTPIQVLLQPKNNFSGSVNVMVSVKSFERNQNYSWNSIESGATIQRSFNVTWLRASVPDFRVNQSNSTIKSTEDSKIQIFIQQLAMHYNDFATGKLSLQLLANEKNLDEIKVNNTVVYQVAPGVWNLPITPFFSVKASPNFGGEINITLKATVHAHNSVAEKNISLNIIL